MQREGQLLSTFSQAERAIISGRAGIVEGQDVLREKLRGVAVNRDWKPVSEFYLRRSVQNMSGL